MSDAGSTWRRAASGQPMRNVALNEDRGPHEKDSSEAPPLCVSLALRAWAFRHEASKRAPPRSAVPMVHSPWVERTTDSAMARPSPVPATVAVARWNRSNTASRWLSGMPGPESSTRRLDASPIVPDTHLDATTTTSEFDRVVDEYSRQSINEGRLRLHEQPAAPHPCSKDSSTPCAAASAPKRSTLPSTSPPTSVRLVAVSEGHLIVSPGQPEQVLNDPPQPIALSANPLEDFPILSRLSRSIEGKAYFCLDHRNGSAQFMRRIGGEFRLSSSDELGGRRRSQTDHGRSSEHDDSQNASEDELSNEER